MPITVETFASVEEASRGVGSGSATRVFGGGTLLMPAMNAGTTRFERVIRITDPAMAQIRVEGGSVRIGAAATMTQVIASQELKFLAPVARAVGGPAVRNMATVGGNLFAPPPYGDFTAALLALDASIEFAGQGGSTVRVEEFLRERDRHRGRIVTAVSVPRPSEPDAFRWRKVSRVKPKGVSVLSIAALTPRSGSGTRIVFNNMGPTPLRAVGAERALQSGQLNELSISQAAAAALEGLSPGTDALASEWYRREVAPVHLARLLNGQAE